METDTPRLDPHTTVANGRITYRSAIRFRLFPESAPLVQKLRQQRAKQVLVDTESAPLASVHAFHERTMSWPLPDSDEWGIFEMSFSGPSKEAPDVRLMHDVHVASQLRVLNETHGPATILSQREWIHLDPHLQAPSDDEKSGVEKQRKGV